MLMQPAKPQAKARLHNEQIRSETGLGSAREFDGPMGLCTGELTADGGRDRYELELEAVGCRESSSSSSEYDSRPVRIHVHISQLRVCRWRRLETGRA
jgi:hypothetical protein